ncbi:hypothetical protein Tco_1111153 [Tanacetum coccineum]|uniref:Uncharacterized protein n=1 Tax=Tanacetum coccineum TaxID=301880 RepID=A0ABQ5IM94_9ASTR
MIVAHNGNENLETTQEQVVEDGSCIQFLPVTKKTEVPVTSSSRSSDLASKFLNFSDIPQTDAEIVSPLDVHVHHEVPRTQAPTLLTIPIFIITESSHDPLHTQVTSLVDEHLDTRLGETREEFMNFLSESLTAGIKDQVKDQLPQILPKEVSNFVPPVIEKLIKESRDEVTLANVSSQPQYTYEVASTLTEFELKKILLNKMKKNKDKYEDPSTGSDRGLKKRKLSKDAEPTTEEPVFEVANSDMPQDQEGNLGDNEDEPRNETASRRPTQNWLMTLAASTSTDKSLKDFDELMSTPIDFSGYILNGLKIKNLTQEVLLGPAFRLLKGIRSSYAELEYDFEECYKALSEKLDWENPKGGDYPFDLSKTLPLIKSGKHQRAWFQTYGVLLKLLMINTRYEVSHIESKNNVSPSMPLQEIPRLRINDIEDMLLLVVQNRLTNLLGDDVADFAIALRMFTSLVIQKRVKDLQLGVESYSKDDPTSPSLILQDHILEKGTRTLHTKTLKDSFMSTTTRGTVLARRRRWRIWKRKELISCSRGHHLAAKRKKDEEEFGRKFVRFGRLIRK